MRHPLGGVKQRAEPPGGWVASASRQGHSRRILWACHPVPQPRGTPHDAAPRPRHARDTARSTGHDRGPARARAHPHRRRPDRKSVGWGKREDLGGRRIIKKKKKGLWIGGGLCDIVMMPTEIRTVMYFLLAEFKNPILQRICIGMSRGE